MATANQYPDRHREYYLPAWLRVVAIIGFTARGIIYLMVGGLALGAALGERQSAPGSKRVMRELAAWPLGKVLLSLLCVGWVFYALWRVVQSLDDVDRCGKTLKGWSTRAGQLINGLVSLGLAWGAVEMMAGRPEKGGGVRTWTARALNEPLGRWLAAAAGVGVLFWSAFNVSKAWRGRMVDELDARKLTPLWHWRLRLLGRVGESTRSLVFAVSAVFLCLAALDFNAREARGLGGALNALAAAPYGRAVLAAAGGGLLAYGAYQIAIARYRQIGRQ